VTTNFLGIPVEGDITRGETRKEQKPIGELRPLLEAVLGDELIASFGWRQYTPYFNDGDACVFSVHGFWVATVNDDPDTRTDNEDLYIGEYQYGAHKSLGQRQRRWSHDRGDVDLLPYEGSNEATYDRCYELSRAIEGGHFDNVLLDAFGDHAEIKVTRDGITVDSYSHD
jgi:hypothetical protein